MPTARGQLATPFRQALLYVVEQLHEVSVMKLEKILYLADLENFRATGERFTGARWIRHRYGPMAKSTLPSRNLMDGQEILVTEERIGRHPATIFRPGPKPRFRPQLSAEAKRSLDRIIAMVRSLDASSVARIAYNTTPMLERLQAEAAAGEELWDVPLTFDNHLSEIARVASRPPRASLEARSAFKHSETLRVEDLQQAAVARSES